MVEAVTGQTRLVWCTEKRDACQLWLKRHHGQLQVACSVNSQIRTLTQQQQTKAIWTLLHFLVERVFFSVWFAFLINMFFQPIQQCTELPAVTGWGSWLNQEFAQMGFTDFKPNIIGLTGTSHSCRIGCGIANDCLCNVTACLILLAEQRNWKGTEDLFSTMLCVVSKILRLQQKTTEIIFQLQKFFMQKLNWTQHKKGSDQTSLIEPFSQISFGTKSFLSLWFSCANAQKACSFQRVAFWSCMRPLRESEGRTLCTGCTNLSKNSHVLALVCFSHVSLFNEHISQMQICFDFKLALLCLLSCHVFDLLAHFGLHAHRIHSSIPHWLLKREHTIVLVALRVGIGLPRRLDNESSAAFCPPQSQWWWANISGFPCGAPGWSETPHGKPNSKLVHKTAQHRLVKSGPKMPGLHCTKSHRPFELFANENHKLWKEAKMNVMFLSLLRWTMLLREESTCQLHSLLWLCLQRQLALNDPEQNVSVRVTCVLTWRSERHGRCDTWTSVSDGGSLFS